ncbi:MAG: putative toxin-antitoxin system toxin component, PIN family [Methylobacteriaceae bacterium]|nr:putative toxin-antitoxin system toxin component, PIN family [Methylobacteriaceae bacterium]
MLRVVLDTSVVVAALRGRTGAANGVLRLVGQGQIVPLVTPPLLLEYEDVLKRAEQRLAHGLTFSQIDLFLAAFASASEPVDVAFRWRPQLSNADDEMIFEAAANGRADALVTYNVRDFAAAAGKFGLRVLKPGELLRQIRERLQ